MKFTKIANVSLKEHVIKELEKSILSGNFEPGDRLPPERELAAAMGTSRSLMNLCILELESRGFVRIVPRQGTFVSDYRKHGTPQILLSLMNFDSDKLDWTLFDNLMETRRLLEHDCTRLAIKNATKNDIDDIRKEYEIMEQAANTEQFVDANFRFHYALTSASGNAVYSMIFNSFEHAIHYLLKLYFSNDERIKESIQYHHELLEAIYERNEMVALETIEHTLKVGIAGLSDVFKQ